MLFTSLRGALLCLPGNRDASTSQEKPVIRRKETKTNVHLTQQTSGISSIATRTMLDKFMQKEINVLAALDCAMQL
jgi:hypothetical protein